MKEREGGGGGGGAVKASRQTNLLTDREKDCNSARVIVLFFVCFVFLFVCFCFVFVFFLGGGGEEVVSFRFVVVVDRS